MKPSFIVVLFLMVFCPKQLFADDRASKCVLAAESVATSHIFYRVYPRDIQVMNNLLSAGVGMAMVAVDDECSFTIVDVKHLMKAALQDAAKRREAALRHYSTSEFPEDVKNLFRNMNLLQKLLVEDPEASQKNDSA